MNAPTRLFHGLDPDEPRPLARPLRRIVVIRALHLGDMLCAEPALRALRAAQPAAQITLIGLPWARQFVRRYPQHVDDLLVLGDDDHLPAADDAGFTELAAAVRARNYDLVLQLHGDGGASNALACAFGKVCAGFHPAQQPAPGPRYLPWDTAENEVLRWLRLLRHLGAPATNAQIPADAQINFPLERADQLEAAALLAGYRVPARYVCMHVGAKLPSRRWPAQRYARVADALTARGWGVVLTGSAGESALTAGLRIALGGRRSMVADLAGRTSLGGLAAVLAGAGALVCNDTGVSHLAAALRVPSVVVACGSDMRRWAPLDRRRHRVIGEAVDCRPCMHAHCPRGHECAHRVSAERVVDAVLEHLQPEHRHAA